MKESMREKIEEQFENIKLLYPGKDYATGNRPQGYSPAVIKVKDPKKTGLVNIREYPIEGEGLRVLINPATSALSIVSLTGSHPRIVLDLSKEWDYIRYKFVMDHPFTKDGIIVCEDKLSEANQVVSGMDRYIKAMGVVRELSKDTLFDFASLVLMNTPIKLRKNTEDAIIKNEIYQRLDMKVDVTGDFASKVIDLGEDEYFEAKVVALKAIKEGVVTQEKGYYRLNGDTLGQNFEDVYEFVKSSNDVFLDMKDKVS